MIKIIKNSLKSFLGSFLAGSIILFLLLMLEEIYLKHKIISRILIISIIYGGITASIIYYFYKKLQKEKDNLRTILHSIGDAVIFTDIEGRIVRMNPIGKELTGWKMENAIGKPLQKVFNIVNAKTGKKVDNLVDKVIEKDEIVSLAKNTILIAKDGNEYKIAESASPIKDDKGDINGFVLIFRDLTEKYKIQKKIKQNEKRLKLAMDAGEHGFWDWDLDTDEVYFNSEYHKMLGYEPGELPMVKDTWIKLMHPEDRKTIVPRIVKYVKNAEPFEEEFRLKCKDGSYKWILGKGKSFEVDENGKPRRVVGVHEDITERKKIKEKLKDSKEKFESYIQNAPDGIFIADENGKYIEVNKAVCEITGYSEEELLNLTMPELIQDEYTEKAINHFQTVNKEGFASGELEFITKSGEKRFFYVDTVKLSEARFLGFVKDITERKKAKKAVKKSEQRYKAIFENTGTATCIIEKDMTISKINKEFEELSGYTKKEVEGNMNMKWTNFIVPKDLEKMKKYHKARRKKGEAAPTRYEFKIVDRDKEKHHILLDIDMIPGTNKSVASMLDITERKQMEKQLQYKTFHDELTGLYNRSYLNEEIKRYDNKRQFPLSIIMGDVNGLKIVNDSFGHKEGDRLLKKIAQIMENFCRQEDLVARIGGDEFVILLPQTSKKEAEEIYTRIKNACQKAEKDPIKPSIALGCETKKEMADNFETVLKKAEDNMYQNKVHESKSFHNTILDSLETMLRKTTDETLEHSQRLEDLAVDLGKELDLSQHELDVLASLANLHDLGKITISKDILEKPGSLSDKEWEEIKGHPKTGFKIANSSPKLNEIAEDILYHHEKWDGDGYPQGLAGEDIPLLARIISIIDAYDVMTNGRPYKEPMSKEEAIKEIKRCAGSQFDPKIVDIFVNQVLNQ